MEIKHNIVLTDNGSYHYDILDLVLALIALEQMELGNTHFRLILSKLH
ncbi:MAG: hypothetical protein K2P17_07135 [Helicobacteraceae bacterium]|nr:hypothetical protein [Helicobacteraceae bacterium]